MKNVTKANVLFSFTVVFYLLCIYLVRLIPFSVLGVNARMVLPELVIIIPAIIYVTLMRPAGLDGMTFEPPSGRNIIRIIIMTFCVMPCISLISNISTIFAENEVTDALAMLLPNKLWVSMVIMALVPAVCEEYLFRGLLFNGYKKRNPFRAMLMSSLLFGLIHMNVNQFLYAFVMGLFFCMLVYATGSIIPSMIAHFVFNAYNVMAFYKMADILREAEKAGQNAEAINANVLQLTQGQQAVYAVIAMLMSLLIVVLGLKLAHREYVRMCEDNRGYESVKRIFQKENRRKYDEAEGRFFDSYIAVGILLCILYMLF